MPKHADASEGALLVEHAGQGNQSGYRVRARLGINVKATSTRERALKSHSPEGSRLEREAKPKPRGLRMLHRVAAVHLHSSDWHVVVPRKQQQVGERRPVTGYRLKVVGSLRPTRDAPGLPFSLYREPRASTHVLVRFRYPSLVNPPSTRTSQLPCPHSGDARGAKQETARKLTTLAASHDEARRVERLGRTLYFQRPEIRTFVDGAVRRVAKRRNQRPMRALTQAR